MTTPSWLDPTAEIVSNDQTQAYKDLDAITKSIVFILCSFQAIKAANPKLTTEQIFWVIGNAIAETGWGRLWRGYNFGGWKITKDFAVSYKKTTGKNAIWWQAKGHVNSGDDPVVYYRGYENPSQFYTEWLIRFVPQTATSTNRYAKTGLAFWKPDEAWFRELCLAGYKGPVTQANPDKSIESWNSILRRSQALVAQYLLSLKPDGVWGPKSTTACTSFQLAYSLRQDGKPNYETLGLLIKQWEDKGAVLPVRL